MRGKRGVISPVLLEEKQRSQGAWWNPAKNVNMCQKGVYESCSSWEDLFQRDLAFHPCCGQCFSHGGDTNCCYGATSPHLKSSPWSPPALQGYIHMEMSCSLHLFPQQNMSLLSLVKLKVPGTTEVKELVLSS